VYVTFNIPIPKKDQDLLVYTENRTKPSRRESRRGIPAANIVMIHDHDPWREVFKILSFFKDPYHDINGDPSLQHREISRR
jgi:hypothetical protein